MQTDRAILSNREMPLDAKPYDVSPEEEVSRLPTLIRAIGAIALGIAMYTFMMKGWQHGSDFSRYLMMLANTVVLVTAGLLSGRWLHESKGARLLVMMALASIPANFAILGGFIFSQIHPAELQDYPRYVTWSMDSLSGALGLTALAIAVLAPVAKLGFSVLARSFSTPLAALFIASNATLLLPLRDAHWVSGLALSLAAAYLFFSQIMNRKSAENKTSEGIIAMALLYLPLAVLLGRNVWLYNSSFFIFFASILCVYGLLRRIAVTLSDTSIVRQLLHLLSAVSAFTMSVLPTHIFHYHDTPAHALILPLSMLLAAGMLYDISLRASIWKTFYRTSSTLMLSAYFFINLCTYENVFSAQLCLASGVAMLFMGQHKQQRSVFIAGVVMVVVGMFYNLLQVYENFNLGGWATLAIMGIALIVLASWIETKGKSLKPRLALWKERYQRWEY